MRKYFALAAALALVASLMAGCRRNVSDHSDGMITDPTGTAATMPSTDTVPDLTTEPSSVGGSITDGNGNSGMTEGNGNSGMTEGNGGSGVTEGNGGSGTTEGSSGMTDAAGESGTAEGRARNAHPGRKDNRN